MKYTTLCRLHISPSALLTALEKDDSLLGVQSRAWRIGVVSHTCGLGFWRGLWAPVLLPGTRQLQAEVEGPLVNKWEVDPGTPGVLSRLLFKLSLFLLNLCMTTAHVKHCQAGNLTR